MLPFAAKATVRLMLLQPRSQVSHTKEPQGGKVSTRPFKQGLAEALTGHCVSLLLKTAIHGNIRDRQGQFRA